jgi:deoxyadenosine/deoxycytidine kinase
MRASHFSYTQQDFTYYDRVLKKLCKMIERGQDKDPDHYGMVAA